MKKLFAIYFLLILLSISCKTEEENEQTKENNEYQKIQSLLNKYKTEYQAQEILDSTFIYTQDYQKNFTDKEIIFVCGEDYSIVSDKGIIRLSRIVDIFNKNDTTYLLIWFNSENYDFQILGKLKCPDSLINYSRIKKGSILFIVAHISDVDRIVFNATGQDDGDGTYSMAVDVQESIISFSGQCKKIITVN